MTGFVLTVTTTLVFGTIVLAILGILWTLREATRDLNPRGQQTARWAVRILIGWAVFAIGFAATVGLSFGILPLMVGVPLILGTIFSFTARGKELLSAVKLHHIIAIQIYRIAGFIFLYLYYETGLLTRGFALNAGWGDVLTGVLAAPVAWLVWKQVRGYQYYAIAWCILGIGDLINAGVSSRLYGPASLVDFPINTVPLFLGPPLGILLHIFALRIVWLQHRRSLVTTTKAA
jgi:hypothetical protein